MKNCAFGITTRSVLALWMVLVVGCDDKPYEYFQGPDDTTAFQDEEAVFLCIIEVNASIAIDWDINGSHFLHNAQKGYYKPYTENSTNTYTFVYHYFHLPARAEYNNSRVQCRFTPTYNSTWTYSDIAILTIQGPPEAVSDLKVETSGDDIVVMWQAPFTLDVTGVEYDLFYSLLISVVTNKTKPVPVTCDVCHSLTETTFTFTFTPPNSLQSHTSNLTEINSTSNSSDHSFTFTVTPYNGAGRGPPRTAALGSVDESKTWSSRVLSDLEPVATLLPTESIPTTVTTPTQSSNGPFTQAILLGVISGTFLLLFLLSFGVFLLLYYITIKKQRRDIATKENPIYNICMNESLKMDRNIAYNTTTIDSEMSRNIAYDTTVIDGEMSRNIAYDTTVIDGEMSRNIAYDTTVIDGEMSRNVAYDTTVIDGEMSRNIAYDTTTIDGEMSRNVAYEMTVIEGNMTQNVAYETARTEVKNHVYETVNV